MIDLALWRARIGNYGCKPPIVVQESRHVKPHGIQCASHLSMLKKIRLLQAGDVELNPGPDNDDGYQMLTNGILLSETDLPFLVYSTKHAVSKWKQIGLNLGFEDSELAAIEENSLLIPEGDIGYFEGMLSCWLKWTPPKHNWPTFGTLAIAFQTCGYGNLVEKLRLVFLQQQGSDTIVAERDLFNLLTIIDGAAPKWKTVGNFLGVLNSELATIEQKPLLISEGSTGYFREMLSQWLKQGPPKHDWPSIESLVSALRNAGEEKAAHDLQEKHLLKSGNQYIFSRKVLMLVSGKPGCGKSSVIQAITNEIQKQKASYSSSLTCIMHCSRLFKQAKIGTEWYPLEDVKHACMDNCRVRCHSKGSDTFMSPGCDSERKCHINLIYIVDTRGHPAFCNMLPFLLRGTSQVVMLFVTKLSEELAGQYDDLLQPLKECMSAVSAMENVPPYKLAVVGTHRDQEHKCMETRQQKYMKLQEILSGLLVEGENVISYKGNLDFVFPLDTKHPTQDDFHTVSQLKSEITEELRALVQDVIPYPVFQLYLALQQQMKSNNRYVVNRSECFSVAQQFHFTDSSLEAALQYLNKLDVLLYLPHELSSVAIDQQVLVDKFSELVEYCYHLRQGTTPCRCLTSEDIWPKFRKYGIVSHELLGIFTRHRSEIFTESELLKLLISHLIVAKIGPDEYIMPCLAPVVELSEPVSSSVPALLLSFSNRRLPAGTFCALCCYLLSHGNWKLLLDSSGQPQVTRRRINFASPTGHLGAISLSEFPSFLEVGVHLSSNSYDSRIYSTLCPKIRKDILDAVHNTFDILGYSDSIMFQEAFMCTESSSCISSPHPAIIQEGYKWMKCIHNPCAEVIKLQFQHRQWFDTIHTNLTDHTTVQELVQAKRILKRPFMQCVLLGQTGYGKSSLLNMLTGASSTLPSTKHVEEYNIQQMVVRVDGLEWEIMDYDDETYLLFEDTSEIEVLRNAFEQFSLRLPATASVQTKRASDLKSPLEIVRSAFTRNISTVSENNCFALHIIDTGGQPEFQEILPAFLSGSPLYFILLRLDKELSEKYSVDYLSSRGLTKYQFYDFSVKDYVLQTLAIIASASFTKDTSTRTQIVFIGTHRELVSEEQVSRIDCELQQLIKYTLLCKEGLVQFASRDRLIMEFNSSLGVDTAIGQIHSLIKRLSTQEKFNCSVPQSWLMLDLILRQSQLRILSFDECFRVANECGIGTHDELEEALQFLSERKGSIKYSESESIVLTDLQYTVEMFTNLFHRSPPPDTVTTNRGIVTLDSLPKLALMEKLHPSMLIRLLESFHLANRIAVEGTAEPEYFVPCSLPCTSFEDTSEMLLKKSQKLPLMIHFDCGYIPMGFFGGLVACLIGSNVQSGLDWKLTDEQAFKNRIKFHIRSLLETVTLVTHLSDIEVNITNSLSKTHNLSNESLFSEIRRCLEKCCEAVLQSLNLRNTIKYSFGFPCPGIGMKDETTPHAAVIEFHHGQVDKLVCVHTEKIWDAPQECILWFGQEESTSGLPTLVRVEADSPVAVAAKGHGAMAILDQDLSDTAGRLLRSQDLKTLTDVLADVETKWRAIGVALGLSQHSLETLQRSPTVRPLSVVLKLWLQNPKQPTVEHFARILQDIGERTTAQRIRKEFSHQEESPLMHDRPTIKDLAIIPIEDSQWYSLGIKLGLQKDVLNLLEERYSNPTRRKREMFKKWLEGVPDPSWSPLLTALEGMGATEISERVRMEYNLPPPLPVIPPQQPKEIEEVDAGFVDSEGLEQTELQDGEAADNVLSPSDPLSEEPKTEPQRTNSPEYLAFMAHFDNIAASLSTLNLITFSSQIFSKSLISSAALQRVVTDASPQQSAESLLTSVEKKIQSNPELFATFLQILRHFHPDSCGNIASQLENSVQVYQILLSLQGMNTQYLDLDRLALKLLECNLITKNVYDNCALQSQAIEKARELYQYMMEQGLAKAFLDILENFTNSKQLPEELKRGESPLSVTSGYATVSASEAQSVFETPPLNEVNFKVTNDITTDTSSSDTFHSFSSDNGVAHFHSRDFTNETFALGFSQQLQCKHSSRELVTTMAPVSSFSSIADVPSNSAVVESVQEAPEHEIMRAFHCGDTATVKSLLQRCSISPDSRLEGTRTLLMMAAEENMGSMVEALLEQKASIDATDRDGRGALHYATNAGNYEVVKMLVKGFANVNLLAKDGSSVLIKPSEKGFSMVVEHLLENGANPNLADKRGWTPLIAAASRDQKDVVKVLLQHGADVTALSIEGSTTALYEAAKRKFANDQPQPSDTVGMLAVAMSKEVQKTQGLFACKTVEDIRRLIKTGARIDSQRGDGCTPLIVHSERGHNDVVMELCKQCALIDIPDKDGVTALMKASHAGHLEVVRTLLVREAGIDLRCRRGLTALMYAVLGHHLSVVKELMTAQAELKTRDKDGRTAIDIAAAKGYTDIVECLERAAPKTATSDDPFNQLLGNYLDKVEKGKNGAGETMSGAAAKRSSPPLPPKNKSNSGGGPHREEYNTQNEQLVKAWKRIADLETRIHDLTLQATMDPPKEEDLSFLERPRLEAEYLKLKEQKRKAEQYAVEAKQTAQRLSAENFKLKENLSKERHDYEFSKKDMLREMEKQRQMQSSAKDTAEAKLEVINEEVNTRALQLMRRTLKTVRTDSIPDHMIQMTFNQNDVLKIIKNETLKGNFLLLAFTGLPKSGKSTLAHAMLGEGASGHLVQSSLMKDSNYYKAAFMKDLTHQDANWLALTLADIHIVIISLCLARIAALTHKEPCVEMLHGSQAAQMKDKLINDTFQDIFVNIQNVLTKLPGAADLNGASVSFFNIWDIGTNKALVEVLQRLGRDLGRLLIVNVLNLKRDADHMNEPPDLEGCEEDKTFMRRRSRVHYSTRMAGIPADKSAAEDAARVLYVLTHADKFENDEEREDAVKKVRNAVHASAAEAGVSEALHSQMLSIDAREEDDTKTLKIAIEKLVEQRRRFEFDMPLRWVFFRAVLSRYAKENDTFHISREKFNDIAHKCWMKTDNDIEEFVKVHRDGCSILSCPKIPVLQSNIIIDPMRFLQGFEKLYYADSLVWSTNSNSIQEHAQGSFKDGIFCKTLARNLWGNDTDLYLEVLEYSGFMTNLSSYKEHCPFCSDPICYFVPTLRAEMCEEEPSPESLFITCNTDYIELQLQSHFVRRMPTYFPNVCLKKVRCHNAISFNLTLHNKESLTIDIIFHNDAVEFRVSPYLDAITTIGEVYSPLKTLAVEIFDEVSVRMPNMRFALAVICPNSNLDSPISRKRIHYMPFHICAVSRNQLFCSLCKSELPVSPEKQLWINAAYMGLMSSAIAQYDRLTEDDLEQVADALLENSEISSLEDFLGIPAREMKQLLGLRRKRSLIHQLKQQQERSECRTKECFAKALLKAGCYSESLRLDPRLLDVDLQEDTENILLERELAITASHISDWEQLAQSLNVAECVREIQEKFRRSRSECCLRMLRVWYREYTSCRRPETPRAHLTRQLKESGYLGIASFLETGENDTYIK